MPAAASTRSLVGAAVLVPVEVLGLAGCATALGEGDRRVPADLLRRAETEDRVRVIVEVKVDRRGIRGAQDEVLRVLESTDDRVTRRYTEVPFLVLEVSPEALRRLAASPAVLRIQEDRMVTPQPGKTP